MRPIEVVSTRLQDVRGSRARCPACGKIGALSFRETSDGIVLLKCFRSCTAAEITAAVGLDVRALFIARTPFEQRDRAENEAREREAFRRDPGGYLRARLRREIANVQNQRFREVGYCRPLRSTEVDVARRRIARAAGIALRDIPAAIGWPLWPRASSTPPWIAPESNVTMPAPWEFTGCDEDPRWPSIFMCELNVELDRLRVLDSTIKIDAIENPWKTIPHALHCAALRARAAMRRLAVAGARKAAA